MLNEDDLVADTSSLESPVEEEILENQEGLETIPIFDQSAIEESSSILDDVSSLEEDDSIEIESNSSTFQDEVLANDAIEQSSVNNLDLNDTVEAIAEETKDVVIKLVETDRLVSSLREQINQLIAQIDFVAERCAKIEDMYATRIDLNGLRDYYDSGNRALMTQIESKLQNLNNWSLPIQRNREDVFSPILRTYDENEFNYSEKIFLTGFKGFEFYSKQSLFMGVMAAESANLIVCNENYDYSNSITLAQLPPHSDRADWTPENPGGARGWELVAVGEDGADSNWYKQKFGVKTGWVMLRQFNPKTDPRGNPLGLFGFSPEGEIVCTQITSILSRLSDLENLISGSGS